MPAPPPPPPPPPPPRTPPPRNASGTVRKTPHGVLEVDWPFFGEMCRALALKVFREYDPDVVIGIARAGVIPGAVVATILQRDFASMAIPRTAGGRTREAQGPWGVGGRLPAAGGRSRAGYPEIRVERSWSPAVTFRGRRLESATASEDQGGFVRALTPGGGWGVASFTSLDRLEAMVARAVELSRAVRVTPPIRLADVAPHRAEAILDLDGDVRGVPIAEKKRLLAAPMVTGGASPVILDPELAGVFIHEAFGHLSEADFVYENPQAREMMTLGRRFGKPGLNVGDNGAAPGLRGTLPFDDEGTPTQDTPLIKEGILVGRLHSRETAATMGERATGNARAISFRHPPIVRMTNTYIANGRCSFEDLIRDVKLGVYACGAFGGQTLLENFSFTAAYGRMIRDGHLAELVKDVVLAGNLFQTPDRIH